MAPVQLTSNEKQQLRGDGSVFKDYLIQRIIDELGNQLGQNQFTQQTARWLVFAKQYMSTPSILLNDSNLIEFSVARMIQGGLAQKDNDTIGTLAEQVVSFLQANAPSTVPQAYLDERTKQWA